MIRAYIRANQHQDSLKMYSLMAENERLEPDKYTFTFVLKACTGLSSFEKGVKIHEEVVKRNLENDVFIGTGLTDMYSKMGDLVSAWKVFDKMPERDVVVWNAMISGVAQCGEAVAVELFKKMQIVCFPQEALSLFRDMQNEYSQPNNVTLVSVIPACAELRAVRLGKSAHCHAIKASMDFDVSTGTALVSMYAKCNLFNSALNLFNKMPLIEVVTWNALINRNNGWCASRLCLPGQSQRGHNSERPACRITFDVLERGHDYTIHAYIIKSGFQSHKLVANSLIDMYAKCGQLDVSERVFEEMENTNSVSWNALLTAYSMHGEGDRALLVFSLMEKRDVEVDSISFLSVLSAGRHAGLVEEGRKIFHCMRDKYHIEPEVERYACLVDLLGRAGLFSEIMDLLKTMPMEPDGGVWGALLDASR
ncbi:hypothetical protein CQW23_32749 [Capsicum baccatum]|uniref:Pentatricopeptide repeat-containing protein n=1 Tax=Capsicum baccatum TaxID=33114 RepID=A0A2G2V3T8_CAPBA|nr:hypothetical protein CQW23_32749 [Capsicum baccatum]